MVGYAVAVCRVVEWRWWWRSGGCAVVVVRWHRCLVVSQEDGRESEGRRIKNGGRWGVSQGKERERNTSI